MEVTTKSFVGKDSKLYIQLPVSSFGTTKEPVKEIQYAVYESPQAYNDRKHLPSYVSKEEAESVFDYELEIDIQTLTVKI